MGIYINEVDIKVLFKNEIITESFFKGSIAKLKIAIRVRDFNEGRAGGGTKHKNSPSIKITNYGKGKSADHSDDGDPVYFNIKNGELSISYNDKQFNSKEIKYIINFIEHNCLNLNNYWFAPDCIKNYRDCEKYQNTIKERILYNKSIYDYSKNIGAMDNEIKY